MAQGGQPPAHPPPVSQEEQHASTVINLLRPQFKDGVEGDTAVARLAAIRERMRTGGLIVEREKALLACDERSEQLGERKDKKVHLHYCYLCDQFVTGAWQAHRGRAHVGQAVAMMWAAMNKLPGKKIPKAVLEAKAAAEPETDSSESDDEEVGGVAAGARGGAAASCLWQESLDPNGIRIDLDRNVAELYEAAFQAGKDGAEYAATGDGEWRSIDFAEEYDTGAMIQRAGNRHDPGSDVRISYVYRDSTATAPTAATVQPTGIVYGSKLPAGVTYFKEHHDHSREMASTASQNEHHDHSREMASTAGQNGAQLKRRAVADVGPAIAKAPYGRSHSRSRDRGASESTVE
eukprot:COSAG03_NODE_835_length_5677_cov_2.833094_4_plen_349_part_00